MKIVVYRRFLVLLVALTPCSLMAAEPSEAARGAPKVSKQVLDFMKAVPVEGDELRQKLAERHNAAVDLLLARKDQHDRGVCSFDRLLDAARLVVDAKLDLAENEEARKQALEDTLEVAKLVEDHMHGLWKNGIGAKADYQRARLGRLSVEVEILKSKRAQKP
jgi:hypothetical protein